MTKPTVKQLRIVLAVADYDDAVTYYRETLGLVESAAFAGPDGAQVIILDAGRATLDPARRYGSPSRWTTPSWQQAP